MNETARQRTVLRAPTIIGSAVALLFWWQSLYPTLMPRTWFTQAVISAVCITVGYAIGVLAGHLLGRLFRRFDVAPTDADRSQAWLVLAVMAGLFGVMGAVAWPIWQNEQRALVSLDRMSPLLTVPMLLATAVLAVVLGLFGRVVGRGVVRIHRFNRRHLPGPLAQPATVVLVVFLAVFVLRDVAFQRFVDGANSAFGTLDTTTRDGTVAPTSPLMSGGPGSLAEWDTLGMQGREFVAGYTTEDELRLFHGADADVSAPSRLYAGIRSASSVQDRADLVVRELDRVGAANRAVVVVATATGTGWIDPDAVAALEYLYAGDTAFASMQYSYLPSWISSLVDQGNATEAGAALFNAVHGWWSDLPEDDRPLLLVFGLSLGSYGAEAAFAGPDAATSVANMVARTDGAMFVGPTNGNTVWRQLVAARDDGSPVWQPVIDEGRQVRFVTRDPAAVEPAGPWGHPRVLYIQHPSDPVVFWSAADLWRRPAWMDRPRGFDVPRRGNWFPFVTWTQGVFDLMSGFSAPPGFGHDYRLDYVSGWSVLAAPEGWLDGDTERLEVYLHGSADG